jgi:anti-sigma factor RsiW
VNRLETVDCGHVRRSFSGYLDGAITGREMQSVAAHLETCFACAADFAGWRAMQQLLAEAGAVKAPADLGLKLRLAISHEKGRRQGFHDNLAMRWENLVRPVALRTLSGLACALLLFGGISMLVGVVAVPDAVLANDIPLGAITMPHYLYSAARQQPVVTPDDGTVVVEADISDEGKVYDWNIVSGPTDDRTRDAVRDDLMLQIYEPSRMFGQPVRGRVLVTFSGVLVKG